MVFCSLGAKDLNGTDNRVLGDAVRDRADGASYVRTMPKVVDKTFIWEVCCAPFSAPVKVSMLIVYAGIYHVGEGTAFAGLGYVVHIVSIQLVPMVYPREPLGKNVRKYTMHEQAQTRTQGGFIWTL